jgi:hypothetical protein
MTLLFMDGCHGDDAATKWSSSSSGNRATANPRFTGGAYYSSADLRKSFAAAPEVFLACAFLWGAAGTATNISFWGDSGATEHITICRSVTSGLLEARRGTVTGTLLATGTTVIPDVTWTQIQVRATVADTRGIVQVRLNGAGSYEIDFTGDTKNAGTATAVDQVRFETVNPQHFVTDLAILDTTGAVNNTWPGDVRVQTLIPSGNGTYSQGINSAGSSTNNYTYVDETPYNSADYVGITTDGDADSYAMSAVVPGTTTVKGLQVNLSAAKSDAGTKFVKRRIRSGGTDFDGSSVVLSTSYATISEILESNPATGTAWTASAVNAVEAGFVATSS